MYTETRNDYTAGSLSRHFFQLMIPLVVGNILQQLYNAIDSVVISRFASEAEFASIGIASSIMNLFLFAIIGGCTGLSILLAQSYGAEDVRIFRKYHGIAAVYGSVGILCLSFIIVVLLPRLLACLRTPEEMIQYTLSYLRIITGGLLISYLYNFYASLLRSVGKAGIALSALLFAVILNLCLDLLFVAVMKTGITGAAAATTIAQFFSAVLCILYLRTHHSSLLFGKKDCTWSSGIASKMIHISMVTCIHQISLYMGKLLIQTFINSAGTDMIMAYTAAARIESFANSFGDSGSAVTSVISAQNFGALKQGRVKQTFHISFCILAVFGLLSAAVLFAAAPAACSFMLSRTSAAFHSAVSYLQSIALFYVFCFIGNTFAGYFEGIGKVNIPFIGALSHMTLRVILSYFWISQAGLRGIALASGIGWILVNIGWALCMLRPQNDSLLKEQKNSCPAQ